MHIGGKSIKKNHFEENQNQINKIPEQSYIFAPVMQIKA
jgi:hypothetical protein